MEPARRRSQPSAYRADDNKSRASDVPQLEIYRTRQVKFHDDSSHVRTGSRLVDLISPLRLADAAVDLRLERCKPRIFFSSLNNDVGIRRRRRSRNLEIHK